MNIDELRGQYWFHDGTIKSFHLDIQSNRVEIELFVGRIKRNRPSGPLQEEDLEPCILQLVFEKLIEVSLFDRFPTQGYYLNFSTFNNTSKRIEVSLNVHDSSSSVHEKDNWVIKARQIAWKEV
jgi:hypothetical protein